MSRPGAKHDEETASQVLAGDPAARRLLAFWPGGALQRELPQTGTLSIGRATECDVRIDLPSVSRRHALLHVGPTLAVEDLGSSNGTRVSGQRLGERAAAPLLPGATLELGQATLVVAGGDALDVARHAPEAPSGVTVERTMDRLERLIDMVAASRISVILLGETGVGKEVFAEAIHRRSPRASRAMVRLHCAALPESLLEGELFGYERGAFTGAAQAKPGLLESAPGGTVFLDEVTELTPTTQVKLLRAIESREVLRLGALAPRPIDVRFVAATNRSPEELVEAGLFRRDLYYRLNGITITIPPLRERTSEIAPLAAKFVAQSCEQLGRPPSPIAPAAMDLLVRHAWPGNIRELRNVVERAVVLSGGGTIEPAHVGLAPASARAQVEAPENVTPRGEGAGDLRRELESLERRRIVDALERSAGNQTAAAKLLGISRRTLLGRLDAYGLPRPRKKGEGA